MGLFKNLTGTTLDFFKIGKGTAGDKQLVANNADAAKPEIKYEEASSKFRYSHDGSVFSELIGDTPNAIEMHEESFATDGTEAQGTPVRKDLSMKPGVDRSTGGHAVRVYCNGVALSCRVDAAGCYPFAMPMGAPITGGSGPK